MMMIEQVYILAFPFRSLVSMTLRYDSLQATSSVLGSRDTSLVWSRLFQCKMPDTWVLLKLSALLGSREDHLGA